MSNDLKTITKANGVSYTVRSNRDRFFYPDEWLKFYEQLTPKTQMYFDLLIGLGARVNEVRHIKVEDIDFDNKRVILRVTKIKAKKGEKNPRPRTISFSSQLGKKLRKHIKDKNLSNPDYLGLPSTVAMNDTLKRGLQKAEIKDWQMFSIHNVRKTHGNWLKALSIDGAEICTRLGHDYNTFLRSYSSPDIFNENERKRMVAILGDIYDGKVRV